MSVFEHVALNAEEESPLYQQLYNAIRIAILSGEVKGGVKLPSTRTLADELNLSRNTVLNAYRKLLAEGYLESIEGSGTFVARILPDTLLTTSTLEDSAQKPRRKTMPPRFSEMAQALMTMPRMGPSIPPTSRGAVRPFCVGVPALDDFPYALWSRLTVRQARRIPTNLFNYQNLAGYRPLREAISAHVAAARRVHCDPDQIIIVSGSQGALNLAVRMLVNPGDPVWMEDPGYLGARGALVGIGAQVIPVPVDHEGLNVEEGIRRASQARLVYLTPSHQFPLGVTMSLTRRMALLDWAERADAYILEDDYDSEYRFTGRPLAALQGLDDANRVIYIGTFSKVLFPALRIGYLVLPPELVSPFLSVRWHIDIHTSILDQAVLTEFMAEGHFARHLRRMRQIYAERRDALLEATRELPLHIEASETGIHCVGWLQDGIDEAELVQAGIAQEIDLWPVSRMSIEPHPRSGLILGYGGFSVEAIRDAGQRLGTVIDAI